MRKRLRLALLYLAAAALLSSIDLTYEWFSPLTTEGGTTTEWYAFVGLRGGTVGVGNHETGPATGFALAVHAPHIFPLPFYAGAGPEGGAVVLAIWFIALVACGVHTLLRLLRQRRISRNESRA
jgi:hypothetical protein